MPVASALLARQPAHCFQFASVLGVLYGASLAVGDAPTQQWITFPIVAVSRQTVYTTVFHMLADTFGFEHFGVLLGLTNVGVATLVGIATFPLVAWATAFGSYLGPNAVLLAATFPLFVAPYFIPRKHKALPPRLRVDATEASPLMAKAAASQGATRAARSNSDGGGVSLNV